MNHTSAFEHRYTNRNRIIAIKNTTAKGRHVALTLVLEQQKWVRNKLSEQYTNTVMMMFRK